jgi:hypothetical protein
MVIAMRAVRMMQVASNQVVNVATVGHGLMAARRAMLVSGLVAAAIVGRRAGIRVDGADGKLVFVNMIPVNEM